MTKTKSNRVISTLCILMVMSMFIACASIFVSADNADTGFDFYFNTDANSSPLIGEKISVFGTLEKRE